MTDRLTLGLHPLAESWKPSLSDKIDMIEQLIDTGSCCGAYISEILDTKEARRAAALALAARELHAEPDIADAADATKERVHIRANYGLSPTSWDKSRVKDAVSNTASKMMPPSPLTRKAIYHTAKHYRDGKCKELQAEPKSTLAFRGTDKAADPRLVPTHVNPVETGDDFVRGGDSHTNAKSAQKERNVTNAEKILGGKDKDGYGYSTNRVTPHIHAKIAAHAEADDRAWKEQAARGGETKGQHDARWKAATDAKAMRAHGKAQFAGNDGKDQQYHALGTHADNVHNDYKDNLNAQYKTYDHPEQDAHRERIEHYKNVGRHGYKQSDKLKYYRELDDYKTDKARGKPVGKPPKKPKEPRTNTLDVNASRKAAQAIPMVKDLDRIGESRERDKIPTQPCRNANAGVADVSPLLHDLRRALLRKTPCAERDALGDVFPSKYGAIGVMALPKAGA